MPMAAGLHRDTVARRKLNAPPGFEFFKFQCIGNDAIALTGCVSSGVFTKGKRKGRPRYDGKPLTAVVTDAEAAAERARYEAETGKCGECCGSGQLFAGWHHIDGTTYRPCHVCAGTGMLAARQSPPESESK